MNLPTNKNIEDYALLKMMLDAQKNEFSILSKKNSNEVINKMKIKMINRVLSPLKEILKNEESVVFLDVLNEEDLPTNSDVVLIISHYEKALISFKDSYFLLDRENQDKYGRPMPRWNTTENPIKKIISKSDAEKLIF